MVSTEARVVEQPWTAAVRAALNQSSVPSFPATFQEAIESGHVLERMWVGTSPLRTNASPTTFHACSFACGPALLHRGVPPQGSPIRPVAEQGVLRRLLRVRNIARQGAQDALEEHLPLFVASGVFGAPHADKHRTYVSLCQSFFNVT